MDPYFASPELVKSGNEAHSLITLTSQLASTFANASLDRTDKEIENGLKILGRLLNVDRVVLNSHSPNGRYIEDSFTWFSERLRPEYNTRYIVPDENTLSLHKKLVSGEYYFFRRLEDIPENWLNLRNYVIRTGIRSALYLPLKIGDRLIGGICMDFLRGERECPGEDAIHGLMCLSEVFAIALARKKYEEIFRAMLEDFAQMKGSQELDDSFQPRKPEPARDYKEIIGKSPALQKVLAEVESVAPTDATVLVLGETGTGKELIVKAIHNASLRWKQSLIKVNTAALPSTLIESLLFGHIKGAFTGAQTNQIGRLEMANHGTLFLDEIAELPLELQPKLLRVLQEGEFEPLGSTRTTKLDTRMIAATNKDLEKEVAEGRFREDLWYRLNVFPIKVPPLRERAEDIPRLVNFYHQKFSQKYGKPVKAIPAAVMKNLQDYDWPGNVRELENLIERAVISNNMAKLQVARPKYSPDHDYTMGLEDVERAHIMSVLKKTKWQISGSRGAAKILKLNPNTLRSRMKKLGITKPWEDDT